MIYDNVRISAINPKSVPLCSTKSVMNTKMCVGLFQTFHLRNIKSNTENSFLKAKMLN